MRIDAGYAHLPGQTVYSQTEEKIELLGGKTSSSVSSKTTAVIVGENAGSKYDKALKLNIPIWSEEELEEKFNG